MALTLFPVKNFPNEIIALVFSFLFVVIIIIEISLLKRCKSSKEDKSSLFFIILGILAPLIIATIFSYTSIGSINAKISYFGIILLISGFILRQYSIKILGKFFIPVIAKQKDQKIIKYGPYKYIRHPSYTGLMLEMLGFSLALSNILSFILTLILFTPSLLNRIKIEESFLLKNFKDYDLYKKSTKKLIPFIY